MTLGCARNDLDSEELAGRLSAQGWQVVDGDSDADQVDVIVVNTCGFVEQAKKDSIDTVLAASDTARANGAKVVAVGCLAERYGVELADSLPEADAVLGFDHYPFLGERLDEVVAGRKVESHKPVDRRTLLPISPVQRPSARAEVEIPGHNWVPDFAALGRRRRLSDGPVAPLKLASGCDRRCSFCAIPSFRGAFVSRPPQEVLDEAAWLADQGVRELVLVSENSTSYGKDWGDPRALEALLPRLAALPGIERVRVSYLQPAETRPSLVEVIATTPGVAPYFDLSFQHASESVLRRMRRFGSAQAFLDLCARIRALAPDAGIRSNVIVGFPGETEADLVELERFLTEARLDAVGVFGYSDEEGTEAAELPDKIPPAEIAERVARVSVLAEELTNQRAEDRVGSRVSVLVEELAHSADPNASPSSADPSGGGDPIGIGRAAHQAPDVDGECVLTGGGWTRGELVEAEVLEAEGVDLVVARARS